SQSLAAYNAFGPFSISAGSPQAINTTAANQRTVVVGPTTCSNVQFGNVQRTLPGPAHEFDFITKLDLQLGSDNISGRYIFNRNNNFNANGTGSTGYIGNVPDLNQQEYLAWTHNFTAHMVNEARISFGRLNVEFGGNNF